MDTILIVESERTARQYLKDLIRNSGVPVEVIMECGDGDAALKIVSQCRVDVLFTDVNIPRTDGIELVRQVHLLPHPPLTVVISSSDDLQHVIGTMRNGAREYVLKPVEQERMTEILRSLESKLEADRENRRVMSLLTMRMIFSLLMLQEISPEEMALLKRDYEPLIAKRGFAVCIFHSHAEIKGRGKQLLHRETPEGTLCILESKNLNPFLRSELPDAAAGVSDVHYTVDELTQAYAEAQTARELAFCLGRQVHYSARQHIPALSPDVSGMVGERARTHRLQLLGTQKREELTAQWTSLFCAARDLRLPLAALFEELRAFLEEVTRVYENSINAEELRALEKCGHFLSFVSLNDYERAFMAWLLSFHEKLSVQQEMNSNWARVAKAVKFMEANYTRDLNMAVVSNHISMNYSLFSHLFKLQTGSSFVNYLKELRIREARRLLEETDLKIVDVSHRVGYGNEKNFMKIFKAFCGVSPGEYRRNMRSG